MFFGDEEAAGWDCNPDAEIATDADIFGLDENDENDWQVIAMDRFADRRIKGNW